MASNKIRLDYSKKNTPKQEMKSQLSRDWKRSFMISAFGFSLLLIGIVYVKMHTETFQTDLAKSQLPPSKNTQVIELALPNIPSRQG